MFHNRLLPVLFGALAFCGTASAEPDMTKLNAVLNGFEIDSVNPTPVDGLYEVVTGGQVIYLSEDGGFVLNGTLIDLTDGQNLTEVRQSELRLDAIEKLGEQQMIVFEPEQAAKHTVTVFTDIDCGYCRKLHQEIASYNKAGIKVRYLMFPRSGIDTPSYDKAVSAWCADDPKQALTRAKRGEAIESKTCQNPIKDQYELGVALGVRGTPAIVLDNGQLVPGYVPAARLATMLDNPDLVN